MREAALVLPEGASLTDVTATATGATEEGEAAAPAPVDPPVPRP